jgi:ATP synthase protein I
VGEIGPRPERDAFGEAVGHKARRKRDARRRGRHPLWFGLGMFGVVGWSVAVPTLLGLALGLWLDRRWPSPGRSWTLALLLAGVVLGCFHAWIWIRGRGEDRGGADGGPAP